MTEYVWEKIYEKVRKNEDNYRDKIIEQIGHFKIDFTDKSMLESAAHSFVTHKIWKNVFTDEELYWYNNMTDDDIYDFDIDIISAALNLTF